MIGKFQYVSILARLVIIIEIIKRPRKLVKNVSQISRKYPNRPTKILYEICAKAETEISYTDKLPSENGSNLKEFETDKSSNESEENALNTLTCKNLVYLDF